MPKFVVDFRENNIYRIVLEAKDEDDAFDNFYDLLEEQGLDLTHAKHLFGDNSPVEIQRLETWVWFDDKEDSHADL